MPPGHAGPSSPVGGGCWVSNPLPARKKTSLCPSASRRPLRDGSGDFRRPHRPTGRHCAHSSVSGLFTVPLRSPFYRLLRWAAGGPFSGPITIPSVVCACGREGPAASVGWHRSLSLPASTSPPAAAYSPSSQDCITTHPATGTGSGPFTEQGQSGEVEREAQRG